jgi:hypothetical protein
MKVTVQRNDDEIVCILPDGKEVEIAMVSLEGEEALEEKDLNNAAHIVGQNLELIGIDAGMYLD